MGEILSTLRFPRQRVWTERVDSIDVRTVSVPALLERLVRLAPRYRALILNGSVGARSAYVDLFAAMILARRGLPVVLADCTWRRGKTSLDRLACLAGIRLLDVPRVRFCVISTDELRSFPTNWRVPSSRITLTPFYYTAEPEELAEPVSHQGGVFAGGDSLRDYRPLIAAARELSIDVTIASHSLPRDVRGNLPANARAGPVSHDQFLTLLRGSTVVVVPLRVGIERSAGQQTYLNAMAMGKVVIVTDSPGARDHVDAGVTGLIVPAGNVVSLRDAIRWAIEPENISAIQQMRCMARESARSRFGQEHYVAKLLTAVDDLVSLQACGEA